MTRIANLELDNKELKNRIKKLERLVWQINNLQKLSVNQK